MSDYLSTAFDIEIDKLTNSIENAITCEVFDTEVARLTPYGLETNQEEGLAI